jgi:positive regulator of sigma E activity
MKKYAIAIMGLAFAALLFGACEMQKGGTIRVTNASSTFSVNVYVTNSLGIDTTAPTKDVVATSTIEPGGTVEIKIDEDGTYYVKPFFLIAEGTLVETEVFGTADPVIVGLLAGSTTSVTVTPIIK